VTGALWLLTGQLTATGVNLRPPGPARKGAVDSDGDVLSSSLVAAGDGHRAAQHDADAKGIDGTPRTNGRATGEGDVMHNRRPASRDAVPARRVSR
jgi:hypothetical protein